MIFRENLNSKLFFCNIFNIYNPFWSQEESFWIFIYRFASWFSQIPYSRNSEYVDLVLKKSRCKTNKLITEPESIPNSMKTWQKQFPAILDNWNMVNDDLCTRCSNPYSIEHTFINCHDSTSFCNLILGSYRVLKLLYNCRYCLTIRVYCTHYL